MSGLNQKESGNDQGGISERLDKSNSSKVSSDNFMAEIKENFDKIYGQFKQEIKQPSIKIILLGSLVVAATLLIRCMYKDFSTAEFIITILVGLVIILTGSCLHWHQYVVWQGIVKAVYIKKLDLDEKSIGRSKKKDFNPVEDCPFYKFFKERSS